jgi:hypothetical protein
MVWAIDQVDQTAKSLNYPDDWTEEEISDAEALYQDEAAQGTCYTSGCNEKCSTGSPVSFQQWTDVSRESSAGYAVRREP